MQICPHIYIYANIHADMPTYMHICSHICRYASIYAYNTCVFRKNVFNGDGDQRKWKGRKGRGGRGKGETGIWRDRLILGAALPKLFGRCCPKMVAESAAECVCRNRGFRCFHQFQSVNHVVFSFRQRHFQIFGGRIWLTHVFGNTTFSATPLFRQHLFLGNTIFSATPFFRQHAPFMFGSTVFSATRPPNFRQHQREMSATPRFVFGSTPFDSKEQIPVILGSVTRHSSSAPMPDKWWTKSFANKIVD